MGSGIFRILALVGLLSLVAWGQPAGTPGLIDREPRLTVDSFVFEGNHLASEAELQAVVAPFVGESLSLEELRQVAERVTEYHLEHGYKLARAYLPEQDFANGTVRILVHEGKIDRIEVAGAKYHSPELIRSYFDGAEGGDYVDGEIIRPLLLINELPDVKANVQMQPGSQEGTSTMVVTLKERNPFEVSLGYNNYGTPSTGENRAGLTLAHNNLSGVGDRLAVNGTFGFPARSTAYLTAGYQRPLNTDGLSLGVSYSNSAYVLGGALEVLDVRGDADIYTVSLGQALCRSLSHQSDVGLDVTHARVDTTILGGAFSRDEYTKARVFYQGRWIHPENQTYLRAGFTQGFVEPSTIPSRVGVGQSFSKLNLDLLQMHRLGPQWRLALRASGQLADSLVAAEQYSVGGPYTVRGYPQGEFLGDSAYAIGGELLWSVLRDDPDLVTLAIFVDHGGAILSQPQPGERHSRQLTGAGVGVRFRFNEDTQARLDLGFPLSPSTNSRNNSPVIYGGFSTRLW